MRTDVDYASAHVATAYVHFPYCLEKCPYCDFVSYKRAAEAIDHAGYAQAVCAELRARAGAYVDPEGMPRKLLSVFFGGGTPSLWQPQALGAVLQALRETLPPAADLEVTVECNPTSLDRARADALAALGVNRLSIGVQSLDDDELRFLGRLHDARGALRAVQDAQGSGIERISADLIVGLPGQAPERAAAHARRFAELGLQHLSVYQLTIEPGTRFGELKKRGRLPMADDTRVAECFLAVHEQLQHCGLQHYEISNYAAPGQQARHNLAYWRGASYLGLGTGAVGFLQSASFPARAVRYRNEIDPARYLCATQSMPRGAPGADDGLSVEVEQLDAETLLRERIMLGLRLQNGLNLRAVAEQLGAAPWPRERQRALAQLLERGRIEQHDEVLRIPPSAWLFTDDTAARLF